MHEVIYLFIYFFFGKNHITGFKKIAQINKNICGNNNFIFNLSPQKEKARELTLCVCVFVKLNKIKLLGKCNKLAINKIASRDGASGTQKILKLIMLIDVELDTT